MKRKNGITKSAIDTWFQGECPNDGEERERGRSKRGGGTVVGRLNTRLGRDDDETRSVLSTNPPHENKVTNSLCVSSSYLIRTTPPEFGCCAGLVGPSGLQTNFQCCRPGSSSQPLKGKKEETFF